MDIKKYFRATPISGTAIQEKVRTQWFPSPRLSFALHFAFVTCSFLLVTIGFFHLSRAPLSSDGPFGGVVTQEATVDHLLIAECMDPDYLEASSDLIIEAKVETVEVKKNDYGMINTYSNLRIDRYLKGDPFEYDAFQIVTLGGALEDTITLVEDQPILHEGSYVRLYLIQFEGEWIIICGNYGMKELPPHW